MDQNQQTQTSQLNVQPQLDSVSQTINETPGSSNKWFKIFLAILVLIVVGVGGYLLGTRENQTVVQELKTSISPTAVQSSPTPTPDPTANWTIYIDYKYSFSFKHPNLRILSAGGTVMWPSSTYIEEIIRFADTSTVLEQSDKPFDGFAIYIDSIPNENSFNKYLEKQKQALLNARKEDIVPMIQISQSETSLTINGVNAIVIKGYDSIWESLIYLPIPNTKKIIIIAKNDFSNKFTPVFNKILSTFKFAQ